MARFSFIKFLFFNKTAIIFDRIIVRFYEQIIFGMWSISILIPLERYLQCKFLNDCGINYFGFGMFFIVSSVILVLSAFAVPKIRQKRVRLEIKALLREQRVINRAQEREILDIVRDALACKDLLSKEGFWQFVMSSIFNFGIVSFYFGIESLINIAFANASYWVISVTFSCLFVICIVTEMILDSIFTRKVLYPGDSQGNCAQESPKKLITSIMSVMSRDSLSNSINNIIFEDVIDDMLAIISVHSKAKGRNGSES